MSMKKGRDKMVRPGDFPDKGASVPAETPAMICTWECNVPGVGTWKSGDIITDPDTISKVKGSPFFQPVAVSHEGG